MSAPDRACPDYPNECVHPWAHARTHTEVKATHAKEVVGAAEAVLVAHQRHRGGCLCGWRELGKSHPGHQVRMLAEAGVLG